MMNALRRAFVFAAVTAAIFTGAAQTHAGMTVLRNGQVIPGFHATTNVKWHGRLYIPAGLRRVVISTSGGVGNCDLYLRNERGGNTHWDFMSRSVGNNEQIVVQRPRQGWWQVGLLARSSYSGLTLAVKFNDLTTRRPNRRPNRPNPHANCNCGCKGDSAKHERILRRRRPVRLTRDEFEPNSDVYMAMQIFEGRPQAHTINPDGDEDWILFVPRRAGRYVLEITNVTTDLKGQLYAQIGKNSVKRYDRFKVRRGRTAAIELPAAASIGFFKIKVEAENGDDIGAYNLNLKLVRASAQHQPLTRRPDVHESDNRAERPAGIKKDTVQLHTISPRDDEDWLLFAPTNPGEYLLKISNVTTKLKGELWVKRIDDKERRADKFEVSRLGRTIGLHADRRVQYFKIRIEADDNDRTGDYRVVVSRARARKIPGPNRPRIRRTNPRDYRDLNRGR